MLKFGNKEFRNLQEQVLKNMQNIANIKEGTAVLSEFGIKVVGEVDSIQDLPTVADYKTAHEDWEYGDAFAIGTQPPYTLVILTRANDEITADHWFDIGDFPAPGPQGERGPQGEQGPQGQTGDTGPAGNDAGFGSVLATAQTLSAGSSATVTVTASGPNTAKEFSFVFGIPRGADGGNPVWGNIQGTLADQTDLKNALDAKQDELVSGTNIKTINNQSVVGSGNIEINSGVWGNITGTLSDQTDLANALAAKQDVIDASHKLPASNVSGLATVATSGSYDDLSNKPSIPAAQVQSDWNQSNSAAVDYIKNKPTIPAAQVNSDWNAVSGVAQILNKPSLATVATTGSYDDLLDKPSIPAAQVQSDYAQSNSSAVDYIKNKPDLSIYAQSASLATVATSGDYDDLLNKPTIPAAQVQSDYAQSDNTQVDYIKNKPDLSVYALSASLATVATSGDYDDLTDKPDLSIYAESADLGTAAYIDEDALSIAAGQVTGLATVATTGDYDDLIDKPTIGDATLTIQKNGTTVDTFTANATSNKTINITVPTNSDYVDLTSAQTITGQKTFRAASGTQAEEESIVLNVNSNGTKIQVKGDSGDYIATLGYNNISLKNHSTNFLRINNNHTISIGASESGTLNTITIPNATGELVLTTNAQTITGQKTFDGGEFDDITAPTGVAIVPIKLKYDSNEVAFLEVYDYEEDCTIKFDTLGSSNRTIHIPNASGTLALTSDIPSVPVQDVKINNSSIVVNNEVVLGSASVCDVTNSITSGSSDVVTGGSIYTALAGKLDATMCTYQTTAPTAAIADGGIHIVYLTAEPTTKYAGYIYMIAEA